MRIARQLPASFLPMLVLAACSGATSVSPSPSASPMPGQPASSAPSPTPAPSQKPGAEGVVVTFRVADVEEYRVLLTDPEDIAIAEQLLAGEEAPRIPNGRILRDGDGGVNTGYSWHVDPASLEFAEVTIEVCDGLPSYVEDGTLSGDQFCPWSAVVIDIQPAE
jgi:hypothetical protein